MIDRNPARGRRMRMKVPKPARTFLEMDELVALTDAAGEQDARSAPRTRDGEPQARSAAAVAARWARGMRPTDIATQLGLSKATVSYHLGRLGAVGPATYVGRRAIVATLGGSGVRVSELCDIRIRDLRLHAATGAHFRIPDAKSDAGIREVQVSPDLVDELAVHLDHIRKAGRSTEPDAYLFQNIRGGRISRQRAGEIIGEAAATASERLAARGLPPLPNSTPHTLRRTYISIALLANGFDVMWVMSQVGHADSKMTHRRLRATAAACRARARAPVRRSRPAARAVSTGTPRRRSRHRLGDGIGNGLDRRAQPAVEHHVRNEKRPCLQDFCEWRDPDSNRGHHDFQSCALPTELSRRARLG